MGAEPETSGWDKIIRAVSTVRTRSALAALGLFLLFFMFWIVLFLTKDILQWVLSIMILLMFGFFLYQTVCVRDITVQQTPPKADGTGNRTQVISPSKGRKKAEEIR